MEIRKVTRRSERESKRCRLENGLTVDVRLHQLHVLWPSETLQLGGIVQYKSLAPRPSKRSGSLIQPAVLHSTRVWRCCEKLRTKQAEESRPSAFGFGEWVGCGSTPGSGSRHCRQSSLGFHVGAFLLVAGPGQAGCGEVRKARLWRQEDATAPKPKKEPSHARATCARHSCSQTFFHRLGPGSPFVYHRRPFVLTRPPTFDDFTIDEFPCFSRPTRHGAARRQPADQGRRAAAAAAPVSARLHLALRHRLARLPALLPDPRPLREAHRRSRMDLRLGRHHRHLPDPRLALHPLERRPQRHLHRDQGPVHRGCPADQGSPRRECRLCRHLQVGAR